MLATAASRGGETVDCGGGVPSSPRLLRPGLPSESDGLLNGGNGGRASWRARSVSASSDAGFLGSRATVSICCHAFAYSGEYGLVTDRIRVEAARMSFGLARLSASTRWA